MNNETQADIELIKTHKIRRVDFIPVNAFEKIEQKKPINERLKWILRKL